MWQKTNTVPIVILLVVNAINAFLIIPYAQAEANQHRKSGLVVWCLVLYVFTIVILILRELIYFKNFRKSALIAALCISLGYWAYQLTAITCEKCASSG